jgi:hypothetical protein
MAEVKNICLEALERHCDSGDTGRLDLQRGEYSGAIYIHDRFIIDAQLGSINGVPALFRLFDWGDAETVWQTGLHPEQPSLRLTMETASVLYAENLRERAELEADRQRERAEQGLQALIAPELYAGQAGGLESILKSYTILLECADKDLLRDGFTLSDTAKNSYVIGSSEDCDVVLRHPTVDPLHCGVILEKGSVLIWDLGSNAGVKINGVLVTQDILKVGDVMTLGAVDLHVRFQLRRPNINRPATAPTPAGAPAAAAPAALAPTGTMPMPKMGPPPKAMPSGAITYEKVSKQLKGNTKATPFLKKLGSLFGGKDRK